MTKKKANKDELIQIRLTSEEKETIQLYGELRGKSISKVVRDYIRRLPNEMQPKRKVLSNRVEVMPSFNSIGRIYIQPSDTDTTNI